METDILNIFLLLVLVITSIMYLYYYTIRSKQNRISGLIIIVSMSLSGVLAIEANQLLTIHFSYEIALLGTFLFWIVVLTTLLGKEISLIFGKYEKFFRKLILGFSILLFILGCFVIYLEFPQ
jgi:CDP-diglyceride synthetase